MLLFYLSNTAAENPPFLVNLLLPSPMELAFVVHRKSQFILTKETGGVGVGLSSASRFSCYCDILRNSGIPVLL